MTCITNIFQPTESPLIIPYYAIPDTAVSTKTGDKLVSTQDRDFPVFLPIGMKGIWGRLLSEAYQIPTARNHYYALMNMIIPHEITSPSKCGGIINASTITPKIIMPGFRMLAFRLWRRSVHSKTFWKFSSSLQNPIFNKFELTHNFKIAQKNCSNFFQINMIKN